MLVFKIVFTDSFFDEKTKKEILKIRNLFFFIEKQKEH